jgi:pimeloyl-ACP methyl ester carboxylesterase
MTAQLQPAGTRTELETGYGRLAALRAGSDGPPALLLPGYTGSKEDFAPLLGPLAEAGFAVTAIDLPGQFESPGPTDPAAYTPARLAPVIHDVVHGLGAPTHLVGHSFGGLVARAAVIAEPDALASLTLIGSGPAGIGGARAAVITHLEPLLASAGLPAVYAASEAIARAQPGYVAPPPALAAFLARRFLAGSPAMLQGMGTAVRAEPDRVAELAATGVRLLVLRGADDDAWPPAVQDEMARRLGADVVVIAGAAHSPALEQPATTAAALIGFWRP